MITKTFFDKGIYKSTLKRFSLGSVLYFIMLFLCTGMLLFLVYDTKMGITLNSLSGYKAHGLILRDEFIFPSMCIALCVPTVISLLVYRFIHAKKMSIFVHSLPVTRKSNYISTLAAAFTLMALPVIVNSIVLMIISACGYSVYFSALDCVWWALFNLLVLFVMFSLSTFAAMCTGNSFALVALNLVLIFAPLLIASITETILLEFLYGYSYGRDLLHFASEINPAMFLTATADNISAGRGVETGEMITFIIFAIVLYIVSYLLYKFRHIETSEDVAGFKILNPIFKYFITFVGTLTVFSIFEMFIVEKTLLFIILVVLSSAIFYFGSEMILKKTVRVWGAYKGYLAFGAVFTAFILFLGLTNVFGYETYVPEIDDIEEAAIYNYYYQGEEPFTTNDALNKYIIEVHRDFTEKDNISVFNNSAYRDTRIHIVYKLKNGRMVARRYGVSLNDCSKIMNEVYNYPEYKYVCEGVFDNRIKSVEAIGIGNYEIEESAEKLTELFECMKEDVLSNSYDELHTGGDIYCNIRYISNNETNTMRGTKYNTQDIVYYGWIDMYITDNFEKTMEWLKNNGYYYVVKK